MTAQRAIPRDDETGCANHRFKACFRSLFWSSIIVATALHARAFVFWPELTKEDVSLTAEELTAIELPPEIEIPRPPAGIYCPATPIMTTAELDDEITIAPTTFETNPVEELPPLPTLTEEVELVEAPTFTPFNVTSDIINCDEVIAALRNA